MLFMTTRRACEKIWQLWQGGGVNTNDQFNYGFDSLPNNFNRAFRIERDLDVCGRRSETISYFRRYSEDTSYTDFSICPGWSEVREMIGGLGATIGESLSATLVLTDRVRNVIPQRDRRRVEILVAHLEPDAKLKPVDFPCESHLFSVTECGILARRANCGAERHAAAYNNLEKISRANNLFLGKDASFAWSPKIDPARFEELVHSLLYDDPQVQRVKQIGHSNEPDGGRDCIAEVTQGFLHRGSSKDSPAPTNHIIVQCKVSLKNINKGSVIDIRDTVDRYQAQGFLLVSFPGVTRPLVDYIESIRRQELFWIEAWTKPDLEARLRANLICARRFPDLVTVISVQEASVPP